MNENRGSTEALVGSVLSRGEYLPFLARHVQQIGIRVGHDVLVLSLDANSGNVSLQVSDASLDLRPIFWVECDELSIESALRNRTNVSGLRIRTGPMGQVVHPRIEQLILRCFQPPPYPADDREELIYPALFGFVSPTIRWQSSQGMLKVLQYTDQNGTFCVSSGFSDPWAFKAAEIYDHSASGAGYELVIKESHPRIVSEFVQWVQYVQNSGSDILPGNWLEYEEGKDIPGTNVAGFLVIRPNSFRPQFPVGSWQAFWHLLVSVSSSQLSLAKRTDVFSVASQLAF